MSEFKKPTAFVDVPCEWVSATSQAEGVPANFVIEHYDDEQLAEANEVLALIVARLSRENAKLRELASRMRDHIKSSCVECDELYCSSWDEDNGCCVYDTLAREAGIKVDE